jgi:hypothetical protein
VKKGDRKAALFGFAHTHEIEAVIASASEAIHLAEAWIASSLRSSQ